MDLRFLTSMEKDADESGEDVTPDGDSQSDEHQCIGNTSSSILWQSIHLVLSSQGCDRSLFSRNAEIAIRTTTYVGFTTMPQL